MHNAAYNENTTIVERCNFWHFCYYRQVLKELSLLAIAEKYDIRTVSMVVKIILQHWDDKAQVIHACLLAPKATTLYN